MLRLSVLIILFSIYSDLAFAERLDIKGDQLEFRLGSFISDFDTSIALTGPNSGDQVNLEELLGLSSNQTVFRGNLSWRFSPNHQVNLGYYSFERSAESRLSKAFTVDLPENAYVFEADSYLKTEFEWQVMPVTYGYTFVRNQQMEVAGVAGLHWLKSRIAFQGKGTVANQENSQATTIDVAPSESVSGPLPVIGLLAEYQIAPKWKVGGHFQYFGIEVDDLSGRLTDTQLYARYDFSDHLSTILAYTDYNARVDSKTVYQSDTYNFNIEHNYSGLEAYLALRY